MLACPEGQGGALRKGTVGDGEIAGAARRRSFRIFALVKFEGAVLMSPGLLSPQRSKEWWRR
jgi:hypothetical protein